MMIRRGIVALAAAALVAGCAPRGTITMVPEAPGAAGVSRILVATSRGPAEGQVIYSRARSDRLRFGRFDVAVPPQRAPGTVTFPRASPPDPTTDFVTVSAGQFRDEAAFVAAVDDALAAQPPRSREVVVFVHGFNTNFPEGLYRHAQMRHDFKTPGVSVHYAWPSAGSVRAYAFDRESALFARDGLEQLLRALARSKAARIVVLGHSMGALVVMDALRQMAIGGAPAFFGKLHAVVLMAPDLDIDVFRAQLRVVEAAHAVPVYVFVSGSDRALRLSAFLRGGTERLGAMRDLSRVADSPITVIDISDVQGEGDALGHFTVATSPSMIALIGGMSEIGGAIFEDEARSPNLFETTINVVQDVTQVVLQPLER